MPYHIIHIKISRNNNFNSEKKKIIKFNYFKIKIKNDDHLCINSKFLQKENLRESIELGLSFEFSCIVVVFFFLNSFNAYHIL